MVKDSETDIQASDVTGVFKVAPKYSESGRVIKVFFGRKLAVFGLAITVLLILTAIFTPWLAPHNPNLIDLSNKLAQPSREHLLGTDSLGRDTLSRIIYGSRPSLMVGFGAITMATIIGGLLGLIAAYVGGVVFHIIMRTIDALMALPMILIAILIASLLGAGLRNIIIALGFSMISGSCRMMCGVAMSVKQNDYVLAGRAMGMGSLRMMITQILPNSFPPILVMVTMSVGSAILAEAGLSFIGIGVPPPTATWGNMINDGYNYLFTNPVLCFSPGIAIALVVFGFNMMGDGLRDALDPRLRGAF